MRPLTACRLAASIARAAARRWPADKLGCAPAGGLQHERRGDVSRNTNISETWDWGRISRGAKRMRRAPKTMGLFAVGLLAVTLAITPATAQQVTGVLGSPSTTTTLEGNQLPPPPPAFGGVIHESAKDST